MISIIYLIAVLLGTIGSYYIYIALFLCVIGIVYSLIQYVFYGRAFDPLFPSSDGRNVIGFLEPDDVVKQQIIVSGHHDSPYIFSFLTRFQRLAFIRFLLGIIAYLFLSVSTFATSIQQLSSADHLYFHGLSLWIIVAGMPFALPLFFMMSNKRSPGAGDNLNATSIAITVSRYFHAAGQNGLSLRHTRLIFLSTDGEEIGQRGAMNYAEKHRDELHSVPTYVFNIDSMYFLKDLAILTRDRNFTRKLSASMVTDVCKVANDVGIRIKRMPIPFGGGGTDASPFAGIGVNATTIIGMPTGMISEGHIYHTERDTVDKIEPTAVAAVLELAIGYIRLIDSRTE